MIYEEKKMNSEIRAFHGELLGITLPKSEIECNQNGGFD
jgi:hypothetical protein